MTIKYRPKKLLKQMFPKEKVERLVTQRLSVNKTALTSLAKSGIVSKKKLTEVALKVSKKYKQVEKRERREGASKKAARNSALNEKKLIVQRVQNASLFEISKQIKDRYFGEYYIWLPTQAMVPDEIHMLNYGQIFQIGVGEMPGERYGCQCGLEILVDDTALEL